MLENPMNKVKKELIYLCNAINDNRFIDSHLSVLKLSVNDFNPTNFL